MISSSPQEVTGSPIPALARPISLFNIGPAASGWSNYSSATKCERSPRWHVSSAPKDEGREVQKAI